MKTKSILLLFFAITILSCRNDKTETNKEGAGTEAAASTEFKVTLNVIAKNEDTFFLYYTEDGSIDFKEKPISVDFGGKAEAQPITFTLPDGVFPTELRLDLGMNKENTEIVLQSIDMEYNGKKQQIAGSLLGNFFRADTSKCTFDPSTGVIKPLTVGGARQCPSLYPQEANLKPEIEKLAK